MATFWTRKGDQEDDDEKTAKPFAEFVGHGNMFQPEDKNKKSKLSTVANSHSGQE